MKVFQRISDALSGAARGFASPGNNSITTSKDLQDHILATMNMGDAGVPVTADAAARMATVGTCVRVVTEDMAALPLRVYRRRDNVREEVRDHPVAQLLRAPAEHMNGMEFREWLGRCVELRGNGYAMKVTVLGRVVELIPLHPDRMTPVQDPATRRIAYQWYRPDGSKITLPREDVLHVRGPSDDTVVGLSTVQHYRLTMGEGLAQQKYANAIMRNGARPTAVLTQEHKVELATEARESLKEDFASLYSGPDMAGKVPLLPPGIGLESMSLSPADAQFLESRKFTRSELAGIFRVPPHMIGDLDRATFSNIEHQGIQYVQGAIVPRCTRTEQALQRDLLADEPELYVKHNVDGLLRGDFKSRQEGLNIQRRAGVITANEWRAREDMNPRTDEGGDEYIVEQNMRIQDGRVEDEQ